MALVPSMRTRMQMPALVSTRIGNRAPGDILRKNHRKNPHTIMKTPTMPPHARHGPIVMFHSTTLSCWCASERAHRRRYDAVCETQLRQYSKSRQSPELFALSKGRTHQWCG